MSLLVEPAAGRTPLESVAVAAAAIDACRIRGRAVLATSIVHGPALLLGARQRRARFDTTDQAVAARRSTGREAVIEKAALHHVLALPKLATLARDARPQSLLNRYARGFLAGYRRLGARADYLGRDVMRLDRRNVGRFGYDVEADGVVLIELVVELTQSDLEAAAHTIASGFAASYVVAPEHVSLSHAPPADTEEPLIETSLASRAVPIGVVEASVALGPAPRVWVGGDLLSSNAGLTAVENAAAALLARGAALDESVLSPLAGMPLDGARASDVLEALREAFERALELS